VIAVRVPMMIMSLSMAACTVAAADDAANNRAESLLEGIEKSCQTRRIAKLKKDIRWTAVSPSRDASMPIQKAIDEAFAATFPSFVTAGGDSHHGKTR
jgi:hypothetical protein